MSKKTFSLHTYEYVKRALPGLPRRLKTEAYPSVPHVTEGPDNFSRGRPRPIRHGYTRTRRHFEIETRDVDVRNDAQQLPPVRRGPLVSEPCSNADNLPDMCRIDKSGSSTKLQSAIDNPSRTTSARLAGTQDGHTLN